MFHGTRKLTVGAGLLVMLVGCGGSSPTTPAPVVSASPTPAPVASDLVAVLNADIQDEYRAEAIYQGVLLDLGAGTMPFANIIRAEQQHARSVAALFTARGLAVPASVWSPSNCWDRFWPGGVRKRPSQISWPKLSERPFTISTGSAMWREKPARSRSSAGIP